MAHPFQHIKDHKVQKSRVSSIARACGGRVAGADGKANEAPRKTAKAKAVKEVFASGEKSKQRPDRVGRKRGGRVKNGKTIVNVTVAPPMPTPPGAMPIGGPGAMAAKPPMAPPPGPPPGGPPPGAPPMGGPGPMPMRKSGGRVRADGGSVKSPQQQPEPLKVDPQGPLGKALLQRKPQGAYPGIKFERARGGGVNSGTKVFNKSRAETKGTHDKGKTDTDDMKRPNMKMKPKVITFKTGGGVTKTFRAYGGKVEAPGPGKAMGPKLKGGVASGEARQQQAERAKRG